MYSASHSVSASLNGLGAEIIDGSGTINPAALNSSAAATTTTTLPGSAGAPGNSSPRGVKRSRSPDQYADGGAEGDHDDDDQNRRKRGRPPKTPRAPNTVTLPGSYLSNHPIPAAPGQVQAVQTTPQMQSHHLPPTQNPISPPQASPPSKTTPTKTLVKALPTVRDHTTDTLNEGQDEYLPKEWDEAGEKKVDQLGYLKDNRVYRCRTFRVPGRGDKLFMLATECARVLGYRDSYLLFNKNRSLHKIIASQVEKDDLIQQDILPYSYRSRQIAIVTARSMFRQFGSRVIRDGRRVRDDYWESKAIKQGFTEEDLAGEKRPGAAKARDAAAAEAAANAGALPGLGHGDIVYTTAIEGMPRLPSGMTQAATLAPLPMIHLAPTAEDPRLREYSSMPRPRQELTGQAYQDRTQPSSAAEISNQATHTAEFNKVLNSQRAFRQRGLDEFYHTPREVPTSSPQLGQGDVAAASVSQPLQSPQMASGGGMMGQMHLPQHRSVLSQQATSMMAPSQQGGFTPQAQPGPHVAQSPLANAAVQGLRPDALHSRTSNPALPSSAASQAPAYGYQTPQPQSQQQHQHQHQQQQQQSQQQQQQQMWGHPPPQPQPSPMAASPHLGMPQYASQLPQQSPSPLPQGQQQQHPSQSPHNQARPTQAMPQGLQMPQQMGQAGMPSMGYQAGVAYTNVPNPRSMYAQSQNAGQQFMPGQPASIGMNMGGGVGVPNWPSPAGGGMQPGQPQQGQSGSPLGGWSSY